MITIEQGGSQFVVEPLFPHRRSFFFSFLFVVSTDFNESRSYCTYSVRKRDPLPSLAITMYSVAYPNARYFRLQVSYGLEKEST